MERGRPRVPAHPDALSADRTHGSQVTGVLSDDADRTGRMTAVSAGAARAAWPAAGAAVPAARHLVRTHLLSHGLTVLLDNAELIVSELVGNVVLHVGGTVEVGVEVRGDEVLLSVSDDSPLSPHLRVFSRTSSTGRGMRLVHSLSAEHGVRPHGDGKTIWVRLTPASSDRGDDELAEVFADIDWIAELAEIDLDGDPVHDQVAA